MINFSRDAAPMRLAARETELTDLLLAGGEFRWPTGLYAEVRAALSKLTDEHCSYCDWLPIDVSGREEVDHFQPKSDFPKLAYSWTNLFLCCSGCNQHKLAQWNASLLRPDDTSYEFSRYFTVNALTGELVANLATTQAEQQCAIESIRIFGLNRDGLCKARRDAIVRPRTDASRPFRFIT